MDHLPRFTRRSSADADQHVSPRAFRIFSSDGSLRDGPPLSGYYTTYPALDAAGNTVFWRDGQLLTVDTNLQAGNCSATKTTAPS